MNGHSGDEVTELVLMRIHCGFVEFVSNHPANQAACALMSVRTAAILWVERLRILRFKTSNGDVKQVCNIPFDRCSFNWIGVIDTQCAVQSNLQF